MISRPNLLEVEDMVKGFPDQMLFQQAQNPTGEIPQFLLVSEIQRRSNMRKDYEAQQQQPENTVAEQIMQQGIAASVPNQPQMPSMSQQNMAPMPPQMPPQGMPPQQQPMMPMPPQMPPQQPQMPNMGMAQGGAVKMQNLGQVPDMMTGREFGYYDMGLPISGFTDMSPEQIRGVIDNLIVSGQQGKAIELLNELKRYAYDPYKAGDPGEMDNFRNIISQYESSDYASTTDVDPMQMAVQDALQQYGDAPSAMEGLIDEGGTRNLDVAGNIPLSVQSEMAADPQNIGFDTPISKARSYLPSRFPLATPTGDPILLTTPTDEEKRQNLIENYATIPNVTQSDVLREKLAIARAGQKASDLVDTGAEGIMSIAGASADAVEPYVDVRGYLGRAGERVGAVKGAFEEEGIPAGLGQLVRSIGGQGIDHLKTYFTGKGRVARDVGNVAADFVREDVIPAAGEFGTQLAYGTQDPAIVDAKNKAAMSNIEQLRSMLPDINMPNMPNMPNLSEIPGFRMTKDGKVIAGFGKEPSSVKKANQEIQAAQGNGKNTGYPVMANPAVVNKKAGVGSANVQGDGEENQGGSKKRNAEVANKLDQIESNISRQSAISELRGLVGAKNYGKVPDMTGLIDEYKDDALSNVLINLGAGIAGGDLSGGLTRAGASALESRRAARDLRKQQLVAEQALQQEGKSRDIDILSAIAKIEAERDISSAVTKRKNIDALKVMYQEQMRLKAATFDENEKKIIDDMLIRIQSAMNYYGLDIPDPDTKKFGELNTGNII